MEHIIKKMPTILKALIYGFISLLGYIVIALLVTITFSGCSKKEPIIIEKVTEIKVPTKCNIALPLRPEKSENIITNISGIAKYADNIEVVALECGAVK